MIRLQSHNRTADKLSSSRRGVTMTEVLIAIMSLGIGMTSLRPPESIQFCSHPKCIWNDKRERL